MIKLDNVSMKFNLGIEKNFSFKEAFIRFFQFNKKKKKLEDFWALKDISFEVEKGEVVLDWLLKHREDINNIEKSYLDDFASYQYSVDTLKKKLKEVQQNQTQLAINELGETRKRINALMYQENKCLNKEDCITDCLEVIDKQIKTLKDKML